MGEKLLKLILILHHGNSKETNRFDQAGWNLKLEKKELVLLMHVQSNNLIFCLELSFHTVYNYSSRCLRGQLIL